MTKALDSLLQSQDLVSGELGTQDSVPQVPAAFLWGKDSPGLIPWLSSQLQFHPTLHSLILSEICFSVSLDYPETPRRQSNQTSANRVRYQDSKPGTDRKGKCIVVKISRTQSLRFKGFQGSMFASSEDYQETTQTILFSCLFSKQHETSELKNKLKASAHAYSHWEQQGCR